MTSFFKYFFNLINKKCVKFCPICGTKNTHFLPLPDYYREMAEKYSYMRFATGETLSLNNYSCSVCGASDRERLYAYWIVMQIRIGTFNRGDRLLHFAPEFALSKKLLELKYFQYHTADYSMDGVNFKVNITRMPIRNERYDFFICSHVLEHIENDNNAVQELYRITKFGGCGILMAPISVGLEKTLEDSSIVAEAERWQNFGQNDHVRLYAHNDYVERIKNSGFDVEEWGIDKFGKKLFTQLGLKETSILYIAKKS